MEMRLDTLLCYENCDFTKPIVIREWANCYLFGEMAENFFKKTEHTFHLEDEDLYSSISTILEGKDLLFLKHLCELFHNQVIRSSFEPLPLKEFMTNWKEISEKIDSLLKTDTENRVYMFITKKIPLS